MSVSIRPNHTSVGVPQWRHTAAHVSLGGPVPDMSGLTLSDGTDYDLTLPDSVWLTIYEDLGEHFRKADAEPAVRTLKPGDLCRILDNFEIEHHGCDEHPDGVVTDVRTGKVVRRS